ncbi:MAG: hypothetical protein MUD06_06185 [Rhodospirillales bacterium]|jgi:hypothetical protein|nr:hypothetical protein [Rhodospirillales bacterium]
MCAFTLLTVFSAAGDASAAPCGNLLDPSVAVPAGFGAAYNPLSPTKELLLRGTECAAGTAKIGVGSGGAEQYVYKNALYWTGSAWQELPLSGSTLVSDTWYKGSATASMPIGETPRYLLGYVCQSSAGGWKCGCSDATCVKPQWQLQAIQTPSGSGGATGVCAAGATPPAQAAAAGLTKLAFCDDFSTDTVARGTTTAARDITGGKKWTTERAALFGSVAPTSADSFVFNSDGTLTVTPNQQQFQWFMSSTVLRDNALKGFWIAKKPKFYAEIRWKFKKGASTAQQPAFWSMDACHLYGKPAPCSAKNSNRFIEPDFWEYYFAAWGTHYYENASPARDLARCTDQNGAIRLAEDQWFTAGTLVTEVPEMKYYKDDKLVFTRTTSSACSQRNSSGVTTASFIRELKDGDYPILIGSKDKEIITIDYVRVWLAP